MAALIVALVLLAGCSDVGDLPDSDDFRSCLTEAGVDPDDLKSADARAAAFADPEALDCVTPLSVEEQRDVLADVFTTDALATALAGWVEHTDATSEDAARIAGTLAGAGGDPDDSKVTGGALDELVAVAIRHQDGPSTFYREWSEDPEAQGSVPDGDPVSGPSLYLDWLEDHGSGTEEYAEAQEIRALQDRVATAREEAAESD